MNSSWLLEGCLLLFLLGLCRHDRLLRGNLSLHHGGDLAVLDAPLFLQLGDPGLVFLNVDLAAVIFSHSDL